MYPEFMTLDDNTEIVHSEMQADGRVKVYVEKPDDKGLFHNAVQRDPRLPVGVMSTAYPEEIARYDQRFAPRPPSLSFRSGEDSPMPQNLRC